MNRDLIVSVKSLNKSYGSLALKVEVLRGVNFELREGEIIAIRGESGSGKTTFLNILGGLLPFDAGEVRVCGFDMALLKDSTKFRRENLGYVFQSHFMLEQFTLFENALMPALALKKDLSNNVEFLFKKLGIFELRNRFIWEVSGGELQRASLARALANMPKLLLADEPTGALDWKNAQNFLSLIKELSREISLSVILVTHSDDVAKIADKNLLLKDGVLK